MLHPHCGLKRISSREISLPGSSESPASTFRVLGLQACTIAPKNIFFKGKLRAQGLITKETFETFISDQSGLILLILAMKNITKGINEQLVTLSPFLVD